MPPTLFCNRFCLSSYLLRSIFKTSVQYFTRLGRPFVFTLRFHEAFSIHYRLQPPTLHLHVSLSPTNYGKLQLFPPSSPPPPTTAPFSHSPPPPPPQIPQATAILAQNLREKVESISLWQDVTSQTIRELNQSIQGIPNEVNLLNSGCY